MVDESPDLSARGTPRVRRKYRTREEIGGDPSLHANRRDARVNARVDKDLYEAWLKCVAENNLKPGKALTEALQDYLEKHKVGIEKSSKRAP